jgi:uncharacterized protein (TIGR03118 family)
MKNIQRMTLLLAIASAACSGTAEPNTTSSTSDMAVHDAAAPDAAVLDSAAADASACMNPQTIAQQLKESAIVTNAQDPNLINAWGLTFAGSGLAWISDNGTGKSSVYTARGAPAQLTVSIPAPAGATKPSAPTGNVNNTGTNFMSDKFIFATEEGTLAGWQSGTSAVIRVDNSGSGANYKGLALVPGNSAAAERLYAANFHAGTVDVFDGNYAPVRNGFGFVDSTLPQGFAPFNVATSPIGIIVTYALQDAQKQDSVAGVGNGIVNLFDDNGRFLSRLASGGNLNAPWGVAMSPSGFGQISNRLLVGNFGDGRINAFVLDGTAPRVRADFIGMIGDTNGNPLAIDGLWALVFGNDQGGFSSHTLYFTAGPAHETQGLFGQLALP